MKFHQALEFCTRLVWEDKAAWHQEAWCVSGIKGGGVSQWGRGPNLDYKLHEDRTLSVLLPVSPASYIVPCTYPNVEGLRLDLKNRSVNK